MPKEEEEEEEEEEARLQDGDTKCALRYDAAVTDRHLRVALVNQPSK